MRVRVGLPAVLLALALALPAMAPAATAAASPGLPGAAPPSPGPANTCYGWPGLAEACQFKHGCILLSVWVQGHLVLCVT